MHNVQKFEEHKQKQQANKQQRKIKLFEMMQSNIQNHKKKIEKLKMLERQTDHLINPKVF